MAQADTVYSEKIIKGRVGQRRPVLVVSEVRGEGVMVLEGLEHEAREVNKGLSADSHPVPLCELRKRK